MSTTKTKPKLRLRTSAAIRADARLLAGDASRVATAAIDDAPEAEPGTRVGELWLYGVVGGWWRGFDAESVSRALRAMGDIDTLHVRIHSPGGLAGEGVAIANLLRNFDATVITIVDGHAASAASVIAVAGDEVVICPGAQLMLHDASTGMYVWGDAAALRAQVDEVQRVADWVNAQSQNYAGIYAYKAGGTPEQWRQVMTANGQLGTWYAGDEAVAAKLADRVGTIVAVGSPPVAPDDEIDEDDDELLARVEHDLMILEREVPAAARAAWEGRPSAHLGRAPKPPAASAPGSITTPEGEPAMAFTPEQLTQMRKDLGLKADADEVTIVAALSEAASSAEITPPTNTPAVTSEGDVVIPEVRLKDLEAAAASGVAAAAKLHSMEREAFLDVHKSKFPATSRADWSKRFDKDPESTRELLTAAADLVPTGEVGRSDAPAPADGATTLAEVRETPGYKNWEI